MLFLEPVGPERQFFGMKVDPCRTDLAIRYRDNLSSPHNPEVQRMLNIIRLEEVDGLPYRHGRRVILCRKPHEEWVVAEIKVDRRDNPIKVFDELTFNRLEDAEWALFKLQWKRHTGRELNVE